MLLYNRHTMEHKLIQYLKKHRFKKTKGMRETHTSMGYPKGSFYIDEKEYKEFIQIYNDYVFTQGNKCYLIERHTQYCPILIDIDFRFNKKIINRQFTFDHIKMFIGIVQKYIKEIFVSPSNDQLKAFYFKKGDAPYLYRGKSKDGVHIMFPYCITDQESQFYLRDKALTEIEKIFEDVPYINDKADLYDASVIKRNGWIMYGSGKPKQENNYELECILDCDLKIVKKGISDINLIKLLSIRDKNINLKAKECNLENVSKYKINTKTYKVSRKTKINNKELLLIREYVKCCSVSRAEKYSSWIEMGLCLHNINDGEGMLEIWKEFSQKSLEKYDDKACNQYWKNFEQRDKGGLTSGSLRYWASIDNHDQYITVKRTDFEYLMMKSLTLTDTDIAKVVHSMYEEIYRSVHIKTKKIWYVFREHRWYKEESGVSLRKMMSDETGVVAEYCRFQSKLNDKIVNLEECDYDIEETKKGEDDNSGKKKELEESQKLCQKLINTKLKTTGAKDALMKELSEHFHERNFIDKLDVNKNLVGFENGVFDLETQSFRDGKPEDYIMLSTRTNYIEYNEHDPIYCEIEEFMAQVFPNEEIRDYMFKYIASLFRGGNKEEKFHVWIGEGGNGKSKLKDLIDWTLGDYSTSIPISFFTSRRAGSSSAQPDVMATKNRRFAYTDEPDGKVRLNCGLMKEWTGGDKVKGRQLYEEQSEWTNLLRIVLLCNQLPIVPSEDGGVWRRMIAVPFESSFVHNPLEDNEFAINEDLGEKIKIWATEGYFASLILNKYYKYYSRDKLIPPPDVTKYTSDYQQSMDIFGEYIKKRLERTNKTNNKIDIDEVLYQDFISWLTINYPGKRYKPSNREFNSYLDKVYKKEKKDGYLTKFKFISKDSENMFEGNVESEYM